MDRLSACLRLAATGFDYIDGLARELSIDSDERARSVLCLRNPNHDRIRKMSLHSSAQLNRATAGGQTPISAQPGKLSGARRPLGLRLVPMQVPITWHGDDNATGDHADVRSGKA